MSNSSVGIFQRWTSISLVLRIFIGLVIGTLLGLCCPQFTWISLFGTLFVGALKALAPVLVAVLVASSIAQANQGLGPRFRLVIFLYLASTLIAAIVAVTGSVLFPISLNLGDMAQENGSVSLAEIFDNILNNIVENPVGAVAHANYLGILFWAVLSGLALKFIATKQTISVVNDLAEVISLLVKWVIQFAPFGVLGLVFHSIATSGLNIFVDYGKLILLLVVCMIVVSAVINPLIVGLMLRKNPYPLYLQCLKGSAIHAFFTRSSAANIPVNLELCKQLNLDAKFYSVSIPLGATINMNGAAITINVMTLAVCHTLGMEVSFASALLLSIVATLGACGSSGVAGGSLLLIPLACSLFGISNDIAMQAVSIGFIIGVIQDSMETALNSSCDVLFTAAADYYKRLKD